MAALLEHSTQLTFIFGQEYLKSSLFLKLDLYACKMIYIDREHAFVFVMPDPNE